MDQAPRTEGPRMTDQEAAREEPRPPEEIRRDIEETREDLGDTAEALAGKTDVKGQAKARADQIKQRAQEKLRQTTPESASAGASQVASAARENPMPVAVAGAFVAGVLVGWLLGR